MKRTAIVFYVVAALVIAFAVFTWGVPHAATLTATVPDGTCPTVSGYVVTCTPSGTPTPPSPPQPPTPPSLPPSGGVAACAAAGYAMRLVEMGPCVPGKGCGYPIGVNYRVDTGRGGPPATNASPVPFGNGDALIVHFRTPAADPSGGAHFNFNARGASPNVNRVAALSNVPCVFPTGFNPGAMTGQGGTFHVTLTPNPGWLLLQPNADYYITLTNRDGFGGTPSCTAADCPVFIDAN